MNTASSGLAGKQILLIISGGIAAYKSLELIRRLRDGGAAVRVVMTRAAEQFVTPLSVAALSEQKVYTELFSLTDESEMGHIRLSRQADLLVVAPASADFMAKMAAGIADDLATTLLLATDKPVLVVPAMNVMMWAHLATIANTALLRGRGIQMIGPAAGDLACGETGPGRMAEAAEIIAAIAAVFAPKPLTGLRALVTSGPTFEPIDPVRFLGNRSSGKQGHAIAAALNHAGAETILISGPTSQPDPPGVLVYRVETAAEMYQATLNALPVDIAIFAAAVADWRVTEMALKKLKKNAGPLALTFTENPDILAAIARSPNRPRLVIGFAAETEADPAVLATLADAKRRNKGADWIIANDVGGADTGFASDINQILLITATGCAAWPKLSKSDIAARLVDHIAAHFAAAPDKINIAAE